MSNEITAPEIQALGSHVRNFYKPGTDGRANLKSSNKMYALPQTSKQEQRNRNAGKAGIEITNLRAQFKSSGLAKPGSVEYGRFLFKGGHKVGNCYEMSQVAAYLALHSPFAEKIRDMQIVEWQPRLESDTTLRREFSHAFLLVCDRAGVLDTPRETPGRPEVLTHRPIGERVADWNRNPSHCEGMWVVDPWSGIACSAVDYSPLLKQQLTHWDEQGKKVVWQKQALDDGSYAIVDAFNLRELRHTLRNRRLDKITPFALPTQTVPVTLPMPMAQPAQMAQPGAVITPRTGDYSSMGAAQPGNAYAQSSGLRRR